ncbi:MAG: ATP-dependent Clp protease ATP-binding subunit [Candidatus Kerfeldbacteria bacterium]|nr:ATP-dependent Clp protease ATP-binding subunit [Candidatus Kerfeldbacteria bacterium]
MEQLYLIISVAIALVVILALWRRNNPDLQTHSSLLALYSRDLTAHARLGKLDPVVGRHHEISRLIQILSRRTKNNPVLIGNSGVGKTAIVEQLANLIAAGQVPDSLTNKRVLQLDLSGLVAGTKYRGEFEKRLKGVVNEIIAAKREIILFIDELHSLAEAGEATGAIDAADILKPALARGELQAIGATTMEEYQKSIANDETLKRRFQPIVVGEPTKDETIKILMGLRHRYEEYHQVTITDEAVKAAVELSDKNLPDRYFPDKAIDLMDEASAKVRLEMITESRAPAEGRPAVTRSDIESIVREWSEDARTYTLLSEHHETGEQKGRIPDKR